MDSQTLPNYIIHPTSCNLIRVKTEPQTSYTIDPTLPALIEFRTDPTTKEESQNNVHMPMLACKRKLFLQDKDSKREVAIHSLFDTFYGLSKEEDKKQENKKRKKEEKNLSESFPRHVFEGDMDVWVKSALVAPSTSSTYHKKQSHFMAYYRMKKSEAIKQGRKPCKYCCAT